MSNTKLIPPDIKQCQAMIPNGNSFMTFGGVPGHIRCTNTPAVIVTETHEGEDGQKGSMSLCKDCLTHALKQLPKGFFSQSLILDNE